MLVTLNEVLIPASKDGYAVGAFNIYNLETAQAVIEAAEEMKSPVILGLSEKAIKYAGLENITALLIEMAERASIPVVIHLDHGQNIDLIKGCIKAGFSSIMIDASKLSENEKIKVTSELAKSAHKNNISIEAERDALSGVEDDIEGKNVSGTNPEVAAMFVEETDIDAFAVSIGNAHGVPSPDEKLDIERLKKINAKVNVPLVLHGASSTPVEQIKDAIKNGITKINIDTDLRQSYISNTRLYLDQNSTIKDPRDMLSTVKSAMKTVVKAKIQLFGSAGRG